MIYLFEDDERDKLSKLFLNGYYNHENIEFKHGNGNVKKVLSDIRKMHDTDKEIENTGIFLDLVPGNEDAVEIYREARRLFVLTHKVFVVPIPCAEYQFIKTIAYTNIIEMNPGIESILNRDVHFNNPLIQTDKERDRVRNFEKLCKLALIKQGADCINRDASDNELGTTNYCRAACPCAEKCIDFKMESLDEKSRRYLSSYLCIPLGSKFEADAHKVDINEYINIHNLIIDEYNKHINKYKDSLRDEGISQKDIDKRYKTLRPLEWDSNINWWR